MRNIRVNSDTQSVIGNKRLYSGYLFDNTLGLYYLKARMYDPEIGRFLSKDPIEPTEQSTASYNLYLYVDNNPIMRIDPDGRGLKEIRDSISRGYNNAKKAFGKSRSTIFLWKKKLKENGMRLSSLKDESKTPLNKRKREASPEVIEFIKNYRLKHKGCDKETIKPELDEFCLIHGLKTVSASTVGRIIADLKKNNVIPDYYIRTTLNGKTGKLIFKKRGKGKKKLRLGNFRPKVPGDLVQVDAIEIFILGIKRYIITAIDIKSRFAFAYTYKTLSSYTACNFLVKLREVAPFDIKHIQTDNGKEFHKYFHEYLEREKIVHYYNYPRSPKSNAFIERFNRTIQEQHIGWHMDELEEPAEFNQGLMKYLIWYNTKKIHKGIAKQTPLSYYINNFITPEKSNMLWTLTKT